MEEKFITRNGKLFRLTEEEIQPEQILIYAKQVDDVESKVAIDRARIAKMRAPEVE